MLVKVFGPFGHRIVFYDVWGDGNDYVYIFVCCLDFWGIVVAYIYGCGRGIFNGDHSCPMDSLCGGLLVT